MYTNRFRHPSIEIKEYFQNYKTRSRKNHRIEKLARIWAYNRLREIKLRTSNYGINSGYHKASDNSSQLMLINNRKQVAISK